MTSRVLGLGCSALLFLSTAASAQTGAAREKRVEITPYVMMGLDGSSGFGSAVRWPLAGNFSAELEVAQRNAEIDAMGAHLSLLYDLPTVGIVTPYLAGGVGLEQYGHAVSGPSGGPVPQSGTTLTLNAGGGVRVPIDERWGVRTDARYFNPLSRRAPERLRIFNGVTLATGKR